MSLVACASRPNLSSSLARSQDVCQNSLSAAEGATVLVPVLHLAPPSRHCRILSAHISHRAGIRYCQFSTERDIHRFDVDATSIKLEVKDHRQPQAPARALG